jgi:sporulation protein YlmC with PRC-barrel domain
MKQENVKSIFLVNARKVGLNEVYLDNNTKDVVNLIMIRIPNTGFSIAQSSEFCIPPHFFRY